MLSSPNKAKEISLDISINDDQHNGEYVFNAPKEIVEISTPLNDTNLNLNDPYNLAKNSDIIVLKNVHKTYLLGIEGVTALRGF